LDAAQEQQKESTNAESLQEQTIRYQAQLAAKN
jgi:hypothetical protein